MLADARRRTSERLVEVGIAAAVDNVGDSYDKALAVAVHSLTRPK